MTAKSVALLAVLALTSTACATAQPPDYPPQAQDQYGNPLPPDSYQDPNVQYQDPNAQYQDQYGQYQGQYGQYQDQGPYGAQYGDQYGQPLDQYQQYPQPVQDEYAQAPVNGSVDIGFFYNQLGHYGHWVERRSYGWVWVPFGVRVSWRPYTLGHWVMTDYGWTWVSTEPFGWATYHYGRWVDDPAYGWEWIPGYEWGPAWVAWRSGAGYVGWAPLPPEVRFRVGFGLDFGGINLDVALRPSHYCFVQERAFLAPNVALYVAPPARNVTIVNNTVNITRTAYRVENDRFVNRGIPVQRIEQVTGQRVQHYQVAAVSSGQVRTSEVRGNQLTVFQPRIVQRATPPPPPQSRARVTGTDLQSRHQQELQTLQQQQVQERTRMQQLHQREVQGGSANPTITPVTPANPNDRRTRQLDRQRGEQQPPPPRNQPVASPRGETDTSPRSQSEQPRTQTQPQYQPPRGSQQQGSQQRSATQQDVGRRHQAEMSTLEQQHQREQQQLAARHQLEQRSAQQPPPRQQAQPRREPPPQQQQQNRKNEQQDRKDDERRPENPPPPR